MGMRRWIFALMGVLALSLVACGDSEKPDGDDPGVGGAGGDGVGGAGGSEEPGGPPVVESIDPDRGGPAFRIRIKGKNLSPVGPKNSIFFVATEGSDRPTIEAKGVAADSGGTWFETDVPFTAKTGPTLITVDSPDGRYSVEGPVFTVTDDRLTPVLGQLNPSLITAAEKSVEVSSQGNGFYKDHSLLFINDVEHPIDWSKSTFTRLVFTLPPSMANTPGDYRVVVRTPSPQGMLQSFPQVLKVVPPLNLLEAELIGQGFVRLRFDQPVASPEKRYFRIDGFNRRQDYGVRRAFRPAGYMDRVDLELNFATEPGKTYKVVVQPDYTSMVGGAIVEREAQFEGKEF